eukprot:TRINITY_DN3145_c0_g1_i1.p1 TRINITY_DN3145_c0_g1~~TRINITY_DN3145_c0_g1_i1.p1  ORF type:complete len:218 (+),score=35.17 TRINITY_DN3145_c0_g1_i1:35-688(+)
MIVSTTSNRLQSKLKNKLSKIHTEHIGSGLPTNDNSPMLPVSDHSSTKQVEAKKVTIFSLEDGVDEHDCANINIGVRPRRRSFKTDEEKKKFVSEYKKKYKTELCKNWEFSGTCKWGNKCSYAHGDNELKEKKHLHSNFRTTPCRQFHKNGSCFYGKRCQYVHLLPASVEELTERFEEVSEILNSIKPPTYTLEGIKFGCNSSTRVRLPIFNEIAPK